jgi:hypothetical protein
MPSNIRQLQPAISIGDHVHKFGYNADVDAFTSTAEDIIAAGGAQYWPASGVAGASINITSDGAEDDVGGDGALTLTIQGLDANGRLQSETVIMTGAVAVNPSGTYLRIFRAWVATAGVTGTNEGNITIADGTGTFAYIIAGTGQTLQAAYTIPADYSAGFLIQWYISIASRTAAYIEATLRTCTNGGAWRVQEWIGAHSTVPFVYAYPIPSRYPPLTDIVATVADASADNLAVSGGFDLYLR